MNTRKSIAYVSKDTTRYIKCIFLLIKSDSGKSRPGVPFPVLFKMFRTICTVNTAQSLRSRPLRTGLHLELLNKLSLFGESPFLSGLNPLGPSESDLERLTFEKSLKAKNLSFQDKVNL